LGPESGTRMENRLQPVKSTAKTVRDKICFIPQVYVKPRRACNGLFLPPAPQRPSLAQCRPR
jgi:hypothetical protein